MHDPARILIVDDNATNRDILKTRLAVHGYDLLEAGDGEQALAAAKEAGVGVRYEGYVPNRKTSLVF